MYSAVRYQVERELATSAKEAEFVIRRRRALKRVDKELSRGNFNAALTLVRQLQTNPTGGLRGFGAAKQLDSKELLPLLSLVDSAMESIERHNFFNSLDETLNKFSCVILGGLVAAHTVFGYSEGHYADIDKLENLYRWFDYNKSEAESQVRWAALNTVPISHRHVEVRPKTS